MHQLDKFPIIERLKNNLNVQVSDSVQSQGLIKSHIDRYCSLHYTQQKNNDHFTIQSINIEFMLNALKNINFMEEYKIINFEKSTSKGQSEEIFFKLGWPIPISNISFYKEKSPQTLQKTILEIYELLGDLRQYIEPRDKAYLAYIEQTKIIPKVDLSQWYLRKEDTASLDNLKKRIIDIR